MKVPYEGADLFLYHLIFIFLSLVIFLKIESFCSGKINIVWVYTILLGLIGGCTYCIRGLYIQYCAKKVWDNRWILWHISKPFISAISGGVSLIFIKAGLLVFNGETEIQRLYGVYSLSFIAGLNVDNFMNKIESVFKEISGIRESNLSREKDNRKEQ